MENQNDAGKPDLISLVCYIIAAAILIPFGWWLKANDPLHLEAFFRGLFGG